MRLLILSLCLSASVAAQSGADLVGTWEAFELSGEPAPTLMVRFGEKGTASLIMIQEGGLVDSVAVNYKVGVDHLTFAHDDSLAYRLVEGVLEVEVQTVEETSEVETGEVVSRAVQTDTMRFRRVRAGDITSLDLLGEWTIEADSEWWRECGTHVRFAVHEARREILPTDPESFVCGLWRVGQNGLEIETMQGLRRFPTARREGEQFTFHGDQGDLVLIRSFQ